MQHRPSPFNPYMPQFGCFCLLLALCGMCLMRLILFDAMQAALRNLHLPAPLATLTVIGIIFGGFINLPLYRVDREVAQPVMRGYMLPGLGWVPLPRERDQTIVAVNVGGCLIPVALALFEARFVVANVPQANWAMLVATVVNIAICFWLARPIAGVGIAIPAFIPPLAAIALAWILLGSERFNDVRAPVAFIAGVLGPLIGADLLNLRRFERLSAGVVSIGGAGTFDGIVISGITAALFG